MNNAQRSNRFEVAMMSIREDYGDDVQAEMIDLMADARHWCDANDESFEELDRQAFRHYLAELDHELAEEGERP